MNVEIGGFAAHWRHCDQMANYLSRAVSLERTDSFFYSNLLSTVLNELFEIVFYQHQSAGQLLCSILRDGPVDRIELNIPVGKTQTEFYQSSVADAQSLRAGELYTRSLLGEAGASGAVGLLELASDYGAKIWVDSLDTPNQLRLTVDISLEENRSPSV
ncbi:MAG: ubiquinone biosynthesis methyltransferase UbiE [Chthoniobacteraceae bacterium]|nr:ubiquinone biosynthesis methyltransferase UbiE [Chthoniobacteraceae bacterium]